MVRAPCCEKVGLNKGRWTTEEDDILKNYILTHGEGSWRSLPKNAGLLRCGKSCRLRWINYLRSNVKRGNITLEEEEIIVQLHSTFGNRWSLIASRLPGRTDNEIKNYWNSHLSRKLHCFRKLMMINSSSERNHLLTDARKAITTTKVVLQQTPRRSRGRTSRAAMKKNKSSATYSKDIKRNHAVMNNNDDIENRPGPCNSCLVGDEVEDHCTVLDDIAMVDPWPMSTSLAKSTSIDQEGCSNSCITYNYIDDDELMRLDDSDQELLSWLMWDNDIGSLEDEQSGKDQEEAMLAWLLS